MMAKLGRPSDLGRSLDASLRARLDAGEHDAVAIELAAADRHAEAGWVREQIWDFAGATEHYLVSGRLLDALRTALEAGDPRSWAATFEALTARRDDAPLLDEVSKLLTRRGRHEDAARVLELADAGPERRAELLAKAGDRLAAAELLATAGLPRQALEILGPLDNLASISSPGGEVSHEPAQPTPTSGSSPSHPREHALAAALCWDLGDAEGTARHAQRARRAGAIDGELGRRVRTLLARALSSLGHDLAGQLVLAEQDGERPEQAPSELAALAGHGRYRVIATLPAPYAGAAYVGVDRVTLHEVEIHLLLAEFGEHERPGPAVREALERFASIAERADALAHPAIRPLLRLDSEVGLLVMPRREGPVLRNLIRPPGLEQATARARSLIVFMLGALAAGHAAGLVHGSLLPSQIVCDALGRPLLGPFGVHHLAGLVATRTGGLEELLSMTPPERRSGADPTQAGDIYMVGALWAALLTGRFGAELDELPASERDDVAAMLETQPDARPTAHEALARLRSPVDDLTMLAGGGPSAEDSLRGPARIDPRLGRSIDVVAAESWSDTELDMLCTARNPWLQNILDREGRAFRLAAWPDGCRTLDGGAPWRTILDPLALELLDSASEPNAPTATTDSRQTLHDAIVSRLDGTAIVVTPAGERMLALDQLLVR
jgi:serine/threonine protein kinase